MDSAMYEGLVGFVATLVAVGSFWGILRIIKFFKKD